MNRYAHYILDVASELHGYACGTLQCYNLDDALSLLDWLRWRVEEAWSEPAGASSCADVDAAVRALARAVIRECDASEWMKRGDA